MWSVYILATVFIVLCCLYVKHNPTYQLGHLFVNLLFILLIYKVILTDTTYIISIKITTPQQELVYKLLAYFTTFEGSSLLWLFCIYNTLVLHCYMIKEKVLVNSYLLVFLTTCLLLWANLYTDLMYNPILYCSGLTPILQDIILGIHPMLVFIVYSIIIVFYNFFWFNFKALRNISKATCLSIIKVSFSLYTLAIFLGSFWSYYVLGWGGYWFWDPIENISLLIWLIIVLFFHLLRHDASHNRLTVNTLYCFFVLTLCPGVFTYIIRSGLLTSVHSFAFSEKTTIPIGILLLIILVYILYLGSSSIIIYKQISRDTLYFCILCISLSFYIIFPIVFKTTYLNNIFINTTILPIFGTLLIHITLRTFNNTYIFWWIVVTIFLFLYIMFGHNSLPYYIIIINSIYILNVFYLRWFLGKTPDNIFHLLITMLSFFLFFNNWFSVDTIKLITTQPQLIDMSNQINVLSANIYKTFNNIFLDYMIIVNNNKIIDYIPVLIKYNLAYNTISILPTVKSTYLFDMYYIIGDGSIQTGLYCRTVQQHCILIIWLICFLLSISFLKNRKNNYKTCTHKKVKKLEDKSINVIQKK